MSLVLELEKTLRAHANPERARGQAAYMKHHFVFLGITTPDRRLLQRAVILNHSMQAWGTVATAVRALWAMEEREFQHAAIELAIHYEKLWPQGFFLLAQRMVTTKSWWDTVDDLAANVVGPLVQRYPAVRAQVDGWVASPNLWLRRTALIYQLNYKDQTDEARLFAACRALTHEREFFIRKAIGWALRQYARTHPAAVRKFLRENRQTLSPLSQREAAKHL